MKIVTLIFSVISLLLAAAAMVCGLWIKLFDVTEPNIATFHMAFGAGTVLFCFITLMTVVSMLRKKN